MNLNEVKAKLISIIENDLAKIFNDNRLLLESFDRDDIAILDKFIEHVIEKTVNNEVDFIVSRLVAVEDVVLVTF